MWPDAGETQRLLRQVERAEPGAADELWERHRPALRRMIGLRLDHALGRRVDASDVVQDVLLKASQRLEEYLGNPAMPFHLWLRHMARDLVIDAHRRHRRAGRRSLDRERPIAGRDAGDSGSSRPSFDLAAALRDPSPTPAAEAMLHELRGRFLDALDRLDDVDREVVLLRHFEQLSNSEAAAALGLSEAAAGMRHLRALRRLRAILGETPSQA
ncbi:RNA polymerase sigma factor CnrH [Aquisphaera giovannonii]|uniref:RNA polymerase sigma factor CnrH n=1 Tax=Aquisphaera giovannonii TaxID=406548 RepID=A0A5B9WC56_9BACT|nr:sigma-70 family RNA polymerase sigma factor [Aquisphaera giovannonii]QEH37809.1 RNA polymerase sigma factor CnrH [Aquisphaera giovannonii]